MTGLTDVADRAGVVPLAPGTSLVGRYRPAGWSMAERISGLVAPPAMTRSERSVASRVRQALSGRFSGLVSRLSRSASPKGPNPPGRVERRRLDLALQPDRIYAIGDIHGCLDKLRSLHEAVLADCRGFEGSVLLVFLGDYIDRGPASASVIDYMIEPPPPGMQKVCLCGNHEEVLVDVLDGRASTSDWLRFGGDDTLLSYGFDIQYMSRHRGVGGAALVAEIKEAIPEKHVDFLRRLPAAFSTPQQIFVHAGMRPGAALKDQKERDLLWIRDPFLNAVEPDFGRWVVHGHTPSRQPYADAYRINVDTGAYQGGPLTAACIQNDTVRFLQSS